MSSKATRGFRPLQVLKTQNNIYIYICVFPPGLAPLRCVGGVVHYAEILVYCLLFVVSTIYLWFEANAAAGSNWTPAIRRTGRGFLQDLLGARGARAKG